MKPPSAEAILFWIPAFAGMTSESYTWLKCYLILDSRLRGNDKGQV